MRSNSLSRRDFLAHSGAAVAGLASLSIGADTKVGESFVSPRREITDPQTGRKLIQLTSGDFFDMPMYYFIPTFARDQKTIVFQRYFHHTGEVQLYKIHTETGVTVRLTDAKTPNSLWRPHLQPVGFGVRDLLNAVNAVTNEAIYFNRNEIHAVNIETLSDRIVGHVPDDRVPSGLTGVSPNGRYFCYPHFDRAWWESNLPPKPQPNRWDVRDAKLDLLDLTTGETRNLMMVNFWITHSHFYDDNRILFCHTATDYAILMTDLRNPYQYENLRAHNSTGHPNHYNTTSKGVMYEVLGDGKNDPMVGGIYNPDTRARREYSLDIALKRMHVGRDPDARLWFFETTVNDKPTIVFFPHLTAGKLNKGQPLISGDYETYSNNQRSHYHPSVTPDRKHLLFTGGDSRNQTNHLFLLDIADLPDTEFTG